MKGYPIIDYYVMVSGSSFDPQQDVFYLDPNMPSAWVETPIVTGCEWITYRFRQDDPTNAGHPLKLSLIMDGVHAGGNEWADGVTYSGVPGQTDSCTVIDIRANAASYGSLYYYCPNHTGMGGPSVFSIVENASCVDPGVTWWTASECTPQMINPSYGAIYRQADNYTGTPISNAISVYIESGGQRLDSAGSTGCFDNVIPAAIGQSGPLNVFAVRGFDSCADCTGFSSTTGYLLPSSCTLISGLTGVLTGLIHSTNVRLSGEYESFTTTSYNIATGYETGSFNICELDNGGSTEQEAIALMQYNMAVFYTGGYCYSEEGGFTDYNLEEAMNVNNINISFSTIETEEEDTDVWWAYASAYADRRYYVTYTPVISGEKTVVSADMDCPDTDLEVTLSNDAWHTTGYAVKPIESIHNLETTLNGHCSGFKTSLDVDCNKVINGKEKFCTIELENGVQNCWEGNFFKGDYAVVYKTGSFVTSGDKHIIGTGILKVDKLT